MNLEIGTVAAQFLSWEYLFRIFGIVSFQCVDTYDVSAFADASDLDDILHIFAAAGLWSPYC